MSTIFEQKLLEVGEPCYVIAASVSEPWLYTRFHGIIKKRKIRNDNISYFVQIQDVIETREYIEQHVHRQTFRMYHSSAERGGLKTLNCFDLAVDWANFQTSFRKRFKNWTLVVSSLHTTNDSKKLDALVAKSIDIMQHHVELSRKQLDERKLTITVS